MSDDELEIETINLVPDAPPSPIEAVASSQGEVHHTVAAAVPPDPANNAPAQDADTELNVLLATFQEHVTKIAQLVHKIRSQELFRNLGYETFEAYIKSKELRMSRSFIYQLAKVGEVIENAGVDLDVQPAARDLQISKLAQIARLPDPETHRKVLETGLITLRGADGTTEDVKLNDVPVKKLNAHINEALGIPPKIAPAYDPMPEPAFKGAGSTGTQNASAYQTYVVAERGAEGTDWRGSLEQLVAQLRQLPAHEQSLAVDEVLRTCRAMTDTSIPF